MGLLDQTVTALLGTCLNAISAAVEKGVEGAIASSTMGYELRQELAFNELVGPSALATLKEAHEQVVVTASKKLEAVRRHPGYGSTQLVDVLDDAEAALYNAIHTADPSPTVSQSITILVAITKMAIVARGLGSECFSNPKRAKASTRYPMKRRRKITAADVDGEVAALIFQIADPNGDTDEALRRLEAIAMTRTNLTGTVTKILVLLEGEGRPEFLSHMVYALMAAGHTRPSFVEAMIQPPDEMSTVRSGSVSSSTASRETMAPSPSATPISRSTATAQGRISISSF